MRVRCPLRTLKQVKVLLCHLTQNKRIEEVRTTYNGLVVAWRDLPVKHTADVQAVFMFDRGSIPSCPKGAKIVSSPNSRTRTLQTCWKPRVLYGADSRRQCLRWFGRLVIPPREYPEEIGGLTGAAEPAVGLGVALSAVRCSHSLTMLLMFKRSAEQMTEQRAPLGRWAVGQAWHGLIYRVAVILKLSKVSITFRQLL